MTALGTAYPVEIRGVHKTFQRATGEAVKALDAVSFTVQRNTLTALARPPYCA